MSLQKKKEYWIFTDSKKSVYVVGYSHSIKELIT